MVLEFVAEFADLVYRKEFLEAEDRERKEDVTGLIDDILFGNEDYDATIDSDGGI